ncbi:MAG: class I SAM-dependent methyltransferase [Deltaproteobacteria bacterium]|nr:class I SAM-dependent methyltransferase [Deltaproteobacteria bacterium]
MFTLRDYKPYDESGIQLEIESIKKIYAGYSNVYDTLFKRFFYPRIKHAITYMDIKPGDRILDVGVGTGLSFLAFPKHCSIIGIDLSPEMLRQAREKIRDNNLDNIKLLSMDAMSTAFQDDTFDTVFISHVVSVVPDPYRLMEEVRRVCKKNGQVVIVNHFKSRNRVVEAVEKIINPVCKRIGWRSDLCLNEFISRSGLRVEKKYMLKKLDFWHILFAKNIK